MQESFFNIFMFVCHFILHIWGKEEKINTKE